MNFVANIALFLNSNILTFHYLKRPLNTGDLNVFNDCRMRVLCQEMHLGNGTKFWEQEYLIALKTETAVLVTKSFLFYTTGWGKIPLPDSLVSQMEWLILKHG